MNRNSHLDFLQVLLLNRLPLYFLRSSHQPALRRPFFGAEHDTLHDLNALEPILLRGGLQVPEVELLQGLILA